MNKVLAQAVKHWEYIAPLVKEPINKKDYQHLVAQLDELLDIVQDNESYPLIGLVDLLSHRIANYEKLHYEKEPMGHGIDALKYLMQIHDLQQSDLPEVGSQGVVSEILSGKRTLNIRQIKQLAKRFHVQPETFID